MPNWPVPVRSDWRMPHALADLRIDGVSGKAWVRRCSAVESAGSVWHGLGRHFLMFDLVP